jgi:NAD(P)-dependent dehydrogenase (short-subunit alcohol dehydrogenase family)
MSTRPDEPAEVPVTTGRPVALVTGVSVAFLCSDAGRWITGQILTCDGGWERLRV